MRYLVVLFALVSSPLFAQYDSSCSVVVVSMASGEIMPDFNDTTVDYGIYHRRGFFLISNGMYDLEFNDGKRYRSARIISIDRNDQSFRITTCFSPIYGAKHDIKYDTLSYALSDIHCLRLITDRNLKIYREVRAGKYKFHAAHKRGYCEVVEPVVYHRRKEAFKAFYYLTAQGWDVLYEEKGELYYLTSESTYTRKPAGQTGIRTKVIKPFTAKTTPLFY
jgi:hypothetical protein